MSRRSQTAITLTLAFVVMAFAQLTTAALAAILGQPVALVMAATIALRSAAPKPSSAFRLTCSAAVLVMAMLALVHAQGWALLSLGCWAAATGLLAAARRVARSVPTLTGLPEEQVKLLNTLRKE